MAEIKLNAEARNEFGKGAARRIRRADKIPAVLYGHGTDPQHVSLPRHETMLALREANTLLSLQLDDGKTQLALPKQIQRDPVRNSIEHVDLIVIRVGEKVTVEVAITLVGEAAPDTVVNHDRNVIAVEAPATDIPRGIEVSVEGLKFGAQINAGDLVLPEGVTLIEDPETLIVNITRAMSEEELEASLAGDEVPEAEAEAGDEAEEAADEE